MEIKRLIFVVVVCLVMAISAVLHKNGIAAIAGIISGVPFFLASFAQGGGMAEIRITGGKSKTRDPNISIGLGLAAGGIGAASMGDENFPASFRVFFLICFILGIVIALIFAAISLKRTPTS